MSSKLVQRFRLDDPSWVRDPKTEAGKLVGDMVVAEELVADAQNELVRVKTESQAWYATVTASWIGRKPKWPEWKVVAQVESEPKFRAHAHAVADATAALTKAKGISVALRRKAWFIGVLYNVEEALSISGQ